MDIRNRLATAKVYGLKAWSWSKGVAAKLKPGERKQAPARTGYKASWVDKAVDNGFIIVTSLAFLVFLVASLPHVAYFFAAFEPQEPDGSLSDWWWIVAYLIAGAINITEFLLSIKFARDLRNATIGLPWYQCLLPIVLVTLKYWPFILIISGFSWAANLQHAREFHSYMLSTAESVSVTIPFMPYIKTWGDLNPYIVSAFPVLNIAYTLMFDSSRNHLQDEALKVESQVTALQPVSQTPQVTLSDFQAEMMKGFQAMNEANMKALQQMQREQLKVTVETLHHLAGVKVPAQLPEHETRPKLKAVKPAQVRKGSQYEEAIKGLLKDNPTITASEAGRQVGCSHVTAGSILKSLRVTVTEVSEDESEPTTDKLKAVSESA